MCPPFRSWRMVLRSTACEVRMEIENTSCSIASFKSSLVGGLGLRTLSLIYSHRINLVGLKSGNKGSHSDLPPWIWGSLFENKLFPYALFKNPTQYRPCNVWRHLNGTRPYRYQLRSPWEKDESPAWSFYSSSYPFLRTARLNTRWYFVLCLYPRKTLCKILRTVYSNHFCYTLTQWKYSPCKLYTFMIFGAKMSPFQFYQHKMRVLVCICGFS
jgi:hypothetical protein